MTFLNYTSKSILALDKGGVPRQWISFEDAITYYAKKQVAWEVGSNKFLARGGYQKDGNQSLVEVSSIVAIDGKGFNSFERNVPLTNRTLFARDRYTCAYCARTFGHHKLSRDHIHPRSKGGADVWMNVVTACFDCNCDKDDMTLKEAGMELVYAPYTPNYFEKLIVENRNILADQMDFLRAGLPKNSRMV